MKFIFTLPALVVFLVACSQSKLSKRIQEKESLSWAADYIAKPEALRRGNEVPLVWLGYSDPVSLGLIREMLDRHGIEHALASEHGVGIVVQSRDLEWGKNLLKNDSRLKGRSIVIAP